MPEIHHVVVDGSNIATEGRSVPSLDQLDEAVQAYAAEDPQAQITVVVDATFEHRIPEIDRKRLEEAELHGEVVSPPAGTIGRGDAFVLQIAKRTGATVLSNDSFQEFQTEHAWLFDEGRLVGGKPVPGIGWIFTPRLPVRAVKNRQVSDQARMRTRRESTVLSNLEDCSTSILEDGKEVRLPSNYPDGSKPQIGDVWAPLSAPLIDVLGNAKIVGSAKAAKTPKTPKSPEATKATKATKTAKGAKTPKVTKAETSTTSNKSRTHVVNEALSFITFVTTYPVGSTFDGKVASFTSHGAMIEVEVPDESSLLCYLPLAKMSDPPPSKASEIVTKGKTYRFTLVGLDPSRRVGELELCKEQV